MVTIQLTMCLLYISIPILVMSKASANKNDDDIVVIVTGSGIVLGAHSDQPAQSSTSQAPSGLGIVYMLIYATSCMYVYDCSFIFFGVSLSGTVIMQFKKKEVGEATANFDHSRLIGKGAYGSVYLGRNLRNSRTSAAVKILNEV